MNFKNVHTIYFLGIGGIGMSALALFFLKQGKKVYGYDRVRTFLCEELEKEGAEIHYQEDPTKIPDKIDLLIYTPAISTAHAEWGQLRASSAEILKRSQVLGLLSKNYKTLAVAGTHGKTTTSTLLAHFLYLSPFKCQAFLGGISKNYQTNLLLSETSEYMVVEADEFDRSFHQLSPYMSGITSTDADHLDVYRTKDAFVEAFEHFVCLTDTQGKTIVKYGLPLKGNRTYALDNPKADYYTDKLRIENGAYIFDYVSPQKTIHDLQMYYPGLHNVENAVLALAMAMECQVEENVLREGLRSFQGVLRRFDYRIKRQDMVYIDDYAHHPEEIRSAIRSLKQLYPDWELTVIFQPHLYSRTADFADEFAESLSLADRLILLPIYPARELPIPGVDSRILAKKIKTEVFLSTKESLCQCLSTFKIQLLMSLGAGDIDTCVKKIENLYAK